MSLLLFSRLPVCSLSEVHTYVSVRCVVRALCDFVCCLSIMDVMRLLFIRVFIFPSRMFASWATTRSFSLRSIDNSNKESSDRISCYICIFFVFVHDTYIYECLFRFRFSVFCLDMLLYFG